MSKYDNCPHPVKKRYNTPDPYVVYCPMVLCKESDYYRTEFWDNPAWRIEQQVPNYPDGTPNPDAEWEWWPCMNLTPGDDRTAKKTAEVFRNYAIEVASLLSRNNGFRRFRIRKTLMSNPR